MGDFGEIPDVSPEDDDAKYLVPRAVVIGPNFTEYETYRSSREFTDAELRDIENKRKPVFFICKLNYASPMGYVGESSSCHFYFISDEGRRFIPFFRGNYDRPKHPEEDERGGE